MDVETHSRFREKFQFLKKVKVCLPHGEERACHFLLGEVCFYEATFLSGLRFPIYPFIMELLGHFDIAPGQLMPNSWRIVVSYMEIWLATTEGDMIKVDKLVYFYRLKESKEHGYYELVPWKRKTKIVSDLPSSFRYWKSRFFFVSGDEWETPSEEVWGDLPKLLHRWKTLSLGASLFLPVLCPSFFRVHSIVTNSSIRCLVQLRDGPNLRASTSNVLRLQLSMRSQLMISTIWSILALWLCTALA